MFSTAHVIRAQEYAFDSMMRSYVLDLMDSVYDSMQVTGRRRMDVLRGRDGWHGRMRGFRMLSMSPLLPNGEAGGVLILTDDGRVAAASAGAERLLPIWQEGTQLGEPRMASDSEGNEFYIAAKDAGNGFFILAAVSRTHLLGPILEIRQFWMPLAALIPLAAWLGVLVLLWYLATPLHRVVESIRNMKWGRDRPRMPKHLGFYEVKTLSNAISELAEAAIAREELRVRYVSDIVRIQEDSQKRLARDLHDSSLQGIIAAIKRIQLAQNAINSCSFGEHLKAAEEAALSAAKELRDYCDELSPSWVKLGLSAAMSENADRLSRSLGIEVDVYGAEDIESSLEISEEHILAFVRILQEAVSNSARHGGASRVEVSFEKKKAVSEKEDAAEELLFRVADNGTGMAVQEETDYESLRANGHRGLANINERVQLLKGSMSLASELGFLIAIVAPIKRLG